MDSMGRTISNKTSIGKYWLEEAKNSAYKLQLTITGTSAKITYWDNDHKLIPHVIVFFKKEEALPYIINLLFDEELPRIGIQAFDKFLINDLIESFDEIIKRYEVKND